jgi:hypothetical protein
MSNFSALNTIAAAIGTSSIVIAVILGLILWRVRSIHIKLDDYGARDWGSFIRALAIGHSAENNPIAHANNSRGSHQHGRKH